MPEPILIPGLRAIIFDAVGTLIHPNPPAVHVYADMARKHACALPGSTIGERFHDAFRDEEKRDAQAGWAVDEPREEQRWRSIVRHVFAEIGEQARIDALFRDLWSHFAKPAAWRVEAGADDILQSLAERGFALGIASNFDRRLHSVLDGLPDLAPLRFRIVSSQIGWRKPDPRFFAAVALAAGCAPGEILFVGDRRENDYDAALTAGMRGVLLADQSIQVANIRTISCLRELL